MDSKVNDLMENPPTSKKNLDERMRHDFKIEDSSSSTDSEENEESRDVKRFLNQLQAVTQYMENEAQKRIEKIKERYELQLNQMRDDYEQKLITKKQIIYDLESK